MQFAVKCFCGERVIFSAADAGGCVECGGCNEWLAVLLCSCGKLFAIKSEHSRKRVRCPGCKTYIEPRPKAESPKKFVPWDESDGGTYATAAETSLTYLLHRQQTGHELTREEKASIRRLITDKLTVDPLRCPACEGRFPQGVVVCPSCKLNTKTCRRPVKPLVKPAPSSTSDPHRKAEVEDTKQAAVVVLKAVAKIIVKGGDL